jgi:3-oxoacyl-[acyl-carrier protein] reductase
VKLSEEYTSRNYSYPVVETGSLINVSTSSSNCYRCKPGHWYRCFHRLSPGRIGLGSGHYFLAPVRWFDALGKQTRRNRNPSGKTEKYGREADLALADSTGQIFDVAERELGVINALIMAHCHSVDSDIIGTTIESFDTHFAVNARATWLLVREFGRRFVAEPGTGRIISITSDHTAGNLPYGASKGAMDRIVLAAAREFRSKGITANVINPGATDTGWMSEELMSQVERITLSGRVGLPQDCANLVRFLCSKDGGWINAQLLYSNGGIQ